MKYDAKESENSIFQNKKCIFKAAEPHSHGGNASFAPLRDLDARKAGSARKVHEPHDVPRRHPPVRQQEKGARWFRARAHA